MIVENVREEVSLARKKEILLLIKENSNWSLSTLQQRGGRELKYKSYKTRWEADVAKGGSTRKIDEDVWEVCL